MVKYKLKMIIPIKKITYFYFSHFKMQNQRITNKVGKRHEIFFGHVFYMSSREYKASVNMTVENLTIKKFEIKFVQFKLR